MGDRSDSDAVSPGLTLVCSAAVFGCSLVLWVTNSSLVYDGSQYLLEAIQTRGPMSVPGRQGINLVRESPLLLAVHQGVTNTHVLTLLEGIGFLIFPALVWILAFVHARRSRVRFTLVSISCGLSFAAMIFDSVSELTIALPLVVLASLLLTQPTPWSGPSAVLAIVSTGLLFFSHESIVPCAVLLVVIALVRIQARLGTTDTTVSIVVLALSLAVLGGALWTLVFWPNENSHTFIDLSRSGILLSAGAICIVGWAALYGRIVDMEWLRWALLVAAIPFTVLGLWTAILDGAYGAYSTRAVGVTVVAALQLVLLVDWVLQRTERTSFAIKASAGAPRVATVFLLAVLIAPTVGAFRWSTVVGDFRSTIQQRTGVISVAEIPASPGKSYLLDWANATLSLVLRSSSKNAVVQNTDIRDSPFNVDSAEQQIPPEYRWGN